MSGRRLDGLTASHGLTLRAHVSIESGDGRVVIDEAVAELLRAVGESGSLVAAARTLGIPHRTAWKRMQLVEAGLGIKLVETRSGGVAGGYSRLTPRAQDLLKRYWSACAGLDDLVGERWSADGCLAP